MSRRCPHGKCGIKSLLLWRSRHGNDMMSSVSPRSNSKNDTHLPQTSKQEIPSSTYNLSQSLQISVLQPTDNQSSLKLSNPRTNKPHREHETLKNSRGPQRPAPCLPSSTSPPARPSSPRHHRSRPQPARSRRQGNGQGVQQRRHQPQQELCVNFLPQAENAHTYHANQRTRYLGLGVLGLGGVYAMYSSRTEKVANKVQGSGSSAR